MPKVRITQSCEFDGTVYDQGAEASLDAERAELIVSEGSAEFVAGGKADEKATTDARGRRSAKRAKAAEQSVKDADDERRSVQHADGKANDGNANGGIPPADPDDGQGRAEENAAVTAKTTGAESGPPVGKTRAPKARAEKDSSAEPGAVGAEPLKN